MLKEHLHSGQTVIIHDNRLMSQVKATARANGTWRPGQPAPDRYVVGEVRAVGAGGTTIDLRNGRTVELPHRRVCCIVG